MERFYFAFALPSHPILVDLLRSCSKPRIRASTETRREVAPHPISSSEPLAEKLNTSGHVRNGSEVFADFGDGLDHPFYVAYLPAKVLTAAAFARFSSRQEHTFAEKMLSAMAEPNSPRINSSMTAIGSSAGNVLAIVLTGVSGSGKSEVGREVAKRLGLKFLDADDFHSNANKDKMHRGVALTDDDRRDWLRSLREALRQELDSSTSCVLACSALKRVYREQLCDGLQGVRFFYLKIDYEVVARRLELRTDHFFDKRLLDSQFAILEEPQPNEAFVIDQNRPLAEVVQEVLHYVTTLGLKPLKP